MDLPWQSGVKASLGAAMDKGRLPMPSCCPAIPGGVKRNFADGWH